jgi:hypothetical protein
MITPGELMDQASMTSNVYMRKATIELCHELDIDRRKPDWRAQLAPFAPVLAAMIAAAAADFDTGIRQLQHDENGMRADLEREDCREAAE